MPHRKWKETKLQPGTAGPGNMLVWCLVFLSISCGPSYVRRMYSTRRINTVSILNMKSRLGLSVGRPWIVGCRQQRPSSSSFPAGTGEKPLSTLALSPLSLCALTPPFGLVCLPAWLSWSVLVVLATNWRPPSLPSSDPLCSLHRTARSKVTKERQTHSH